MKAEIHISDVRAFRQCRRKWYFSSPLQRGLEPNIPYMPFFLGRAIHESMEDYYSGKRSLQDALEAYVKREVVGDFWAPEIDKVNEQVELARGMLTHYMAWAKAHADDEWGDNNLSFVALETEFSVPIRTPSGRASSKVFLAGRFDGLVINKTDGGLWLWEHKTARSINELAVSLANDEQCGAYIIAAQELFKTRINGVLYNILRKKVPTKPKVLSSGYLSQRANIDTTAEAYADAVNELHTDWSLDEKMLYYGDFLRTLSLRGNTFFARFPVFRTPYELDQLRTNLWATALEMTRKSTVYYPAPSWSTCTFCKFKAPCLAMNAGGNYEEILKADYRLRRNEDEVPQNG